MTLNVNISIIWDFVGTFLLGDLVFGYICISLTRT